MLLIGSFCSITSYKLYMFHIGDIKSQQRLAVGTLPTRFPRSLNNRSFWAWIATPSQERIWNIWTFPQKWACAGTLIWKNYQMYHDKDSLNKKTAARVRPPGSSHYGAHPCQQWCMELPAELTCALSKVLHGNVLILPTGDGPQLALVGIGHPIRATHLLHHDRQWQRLTSHVWALPRLKQWLFFSVLKLGCKLFHPPWSCFSRRNQGKGTRNGLGRSPRCRKLQNYRLNPHRMLGIQDLWRKWYIPINIIILHGWHQKRFFSNTLALCLN